MSKNTTSSAELEIFIRDIPEDGAIKQVEIEVDAKSAAAELFDGLEEFYPAEDDTVEASLRVQRVGASTLHVSGTVWATMAFQCGRCLEHKRLLIEADLVQVLVPRSKWDQMYGGEEERELTPEDMDMQYWEGDVLNLRPMLRESVMLELPMYAVCPGEMEAACDELYERTIAAPARAKLQAEEPEPEVDARWAKLAALKQDKAKD